MIRRPIQSFRRYLLDRMVLRPSRDPVDYSPQQRVFLRDRPLECFVQRNFESDQPPQLLVLKFPGTAGRAERSTPFPMPCVDDTRVSMWTWNPPGYGGSRGRASLLGIADAAIDFWTEVTDREAGRDTTVWLCGNSLGCVTALHVAAAMQPDATQGGMILRNLPPLRSVVTRVARRYPLSQLAEPVIDTLPAEMDAVRTAPNVNLPAVFLQSELDTLVPVSDQNRVIDVYGGPRRVVLMEGIDHGDLATEVHEPIIGQATQWLWNQTRCETDESSKTS